MSFHQKAFHKIIEVATFHRRRY